MIGRGTFFSSRHQCPPNDFGLAQNVVIFLTFFHVPFALWLHFQTLEPALINGSMIFPPILKDVSDGAPRVIENQPISSPMPDSLAWYLGTQNWVDVWVFFFEVLYQSFYVVGGAHFSGDETKASTHSQHLVPFWVIL